VSKKIPIPKKPTHSCACGRVRARDKWRFLGRCSVCLKYVCSACADRCRHCGTLLCKCSDQCSYNWCPCRNVDGRPKNPKLKKDWVGARVVLLKPIENGKHKIPQGAVATVERSYGGLTLVVDPCDLCGVSVRITKVPESSVALVALWPGE